MLHWQRPHSLHDMKSTSQHHRLPDCRAAVGLVPPLPNPAAPSPAGAESSRPVDQRPAREAGSPPNAGVTNEARRFAAGTADAQALFRKVAAIFLFVCPDILCPFLVVLCSKYAAPPLDRYPLLCRWKH